MGKAKKTKDELEQITRKATATLIGDSIKPMALGDITLTLPEPGPRDEDFANAAFRQNAGSLRRLMVPYYRIQIVMENGIESRWGLEKWIKLMDGSAQRAEQMGDRKQPIRKRKAVA